MSNENVLNKISDYYNALVDKFGHDPRSCDYGHANSQKIKFEVLSSGYPFHRKTILDVGCGFADFYDFLQKKFPDIEYSGVDISEKMIGMAKKLHPTLDLEVRNVMLHPPEKKYDIVTANGIFYLLGHNANEVMQQFITRMYDMAKDLVIFNSLSSWASDKVEGEFYADPLDTVAFCKTLSPWVALRHDYHPRDFTVYLYKSRNI